MIPKGLTLQILDSMAHYCALCGKQLDLLTGAKVGRRDSCMHCRGDMHCCRNCSFFDEKAYNQCREPQAERVLEKSSSNYCDYFEFKEGPRDSKVQDAKSKALSDLDALFKK